MHTLQAQVTAAHEATAAKETTVLERDGTIAELESRLSELQDKAESLEAALGEFTWRCMPCACQSGQHTSLQ